MSRRDGIEHQRSCYPTEDTLQPVSTYKQKIGASDELTLVHSRRLVDRVYSGRIAGFETHVQGERVSNYTPWFGSILSNS